MNKSLPGAILLLLAACAASDDEDPPLRIDVVEQEAADRLVAEALALGLTRRDSAGLIVSGVAQSWRVSEDGLSTVFRLRPARFAGGRDVTAADVVASIEDARRRGDPALRPLLAGIASVNAPLDDVVEIRLTTPQPELLELLADPGLGIRPRGRGTQAAAGLGAFQEAASRAPAPGDATRVLERNSAHLAGAAMSAELEIAVRSPEEALARFQRRTVDLVTGGGAAGFPAVRVTAPRESLRLEPSRAVLTLLLDHRSEPLSDLRVRSALDRSIDRPALARLIFGTEAAAPVTAIAPRSLPIFALAPEPDWAALPGEARLAEAAALLDEAGIGPEAERRRRLVVGIGYAAEDQRMIEQIAAGWAPLGIDLVSRRMPPERLPEALETGEIGMALVVRRTHHDSPLPFLLPLRCRANRQGVCVPEADQLIEASWKAATLAERLRAIASAERLWSEDVAVIALFQPLAWSLVQPGISGFETNPAGARALVRLGRTDERRLFR